MTLFFSGIFFILTCVVAPAFATTYWVSASAGSTGDCNSARGDTDPGVYLRTITDGLACVGPAGSDFGAGHSVVVKDGVYDESLQDNIPSGTSENQRFTLTAEHIGGAILRPTGANGSIIYIRSDTHYATITGLVLDGSNSLVTGLAFSSYNSAAFQNVRVSNIEVKHTDGDGMLFQNGANFQISSNWIHDGGACGQGAYIGLCHGMYMAPNFQNSVVDGNTIDHYQGYAIHFYGGDAGGTITGNIVRNNVAHHNGSDLRGQGSILIWGPNNEIYKNISYSNVGPGFHIAYGNSVHDNIAWRNGYGGIYDLSGGSTITNNILIENAVGPIAGEQGSAVWNNLTAGTASDYFVDAASGNFMRR